jgi:4-hydroxybenzoate polyprenyltransferase
MTIPLPDAAPANWVDRGAPRAWRPWLKLARLDRPFGIWLLMLPGWQGIALADAMARKLPDLKLLALFALGATLMRASGCAINDIVDRRIDARVTRTAARPVASGEIGAVAAGLVALACCLASVAVLLCLNRESLWLAVASLPLVLAYPFMKRITWWPQAWLGLTFNWGAILGFAAASGGPALGQILLHGRFFQTLATPGVFSAAGWPADISLYASGVFWTLGYDTVYAIQDMADDARAGVKSSALRLGTRTPAFVAWAYAVSLLLAAVAAGLGRLGFLVIPGLLVLGVHFAWQARRLKRLDASVLRIVQSNTAAGLILFAALALGALRL